MREKAAVDDQTFAEAIDHAVSWAEGRHLLTGMWLDRRHESIGVGISDGDEVETTEALRRLVPAGIRIRTRVASAALSGLWQLQIEVSDYLEDTAIWGEWATEVGHDRLQQSIEVGLLPGTPPKIASQIRDHFPGRPLTFATAGHAQALGGSSA